MIPSILLLYFGCALVPANSSNSEILILILSSALCSCHLEFFFSHKGTILYFFIKEDDLENFHPFRFVGHFWNLMLLSRNTTTLEKQDVILSLIEIGTANFLSKELKKLFNKITPETFFVWTHFKCFLLRSVSQMPPLSSYNKV